MLSRRGIALVQPKRSLSQGGVTGHRIHGGEFGKALVRCYPVPLSLICFLHSPVHPERTSPFLPHLKSAAKPPCILSRYRCLPLAQPLGTVCQD